MRKDESELVRPRYFIPLMTNAKFKRITLGYDSQVFRIQAKNVIAYSFAKVTTLPMRRNVFTGDLMEFAITQEEEF